MERDAIDFPEALRRLAARAGVELSERTTREDARRKRLREALDAAIAFYHRVLTESRHGRPALDYLHSRGFTDETISTHQLGFAVDAWDTLGRSLIEKRGFREEELEAAGLVSRRQGRRGVYDRFRGRIIFPIRDASGNATGLGGRIIGAQQTGEGARDQGPKYLNSPSTLLFDKSRTLYLIDRAKSAIRKSGVAVLVEGNTDALMGHQQGFENVVGTLKADEIHGDGARNRLDGRRGPDRIFGGGGPDIIQGGDGNDVLFGQRGNDVLLGDSGKDQLDGGKDRDVCKGGTGPDSFVSCETINAGPGSIRLI